MLHEKDEKKFKKARSILQSLKCRATVSRKEETTAETIPVS